MAPCWSCGYPVGVEIRKCPFCDARLKKSFLTLFFMILFVLIFSGLIVYIVK